MMLYLIIGIRCVKCVLQDGSADEFRYLGDD